MADFTEKDLVEVAALAKLTLKEDTMGTRLKEFQDILGHIDTLTQVDTNALKNPATSKLHMHEDTPVKSFTIDQTLSNAIDAQPPFFTIPKFMTSKDPS